MIRRDYILRMIEEFARRLALIQKYQKELKLQDAASELDAEFQRLLGAGPAAVAEMSDTALFARLLSAESTQTVSFKASAIVALLREAGDLAAAQNRVHDARKYHLAGLRLLLLIRRREESFDFPEFVPKIEFFVRVLGKAEFPLELSALLMEHYERSGEFARAEDLLFAMRANFPEQTNLTEFGLAFCDRLLEQPDSVLVAGGLPREEVLSARRELAGETSQR